MSFANEMLSNAEEIMVEPRLSIIPIIINFIMGLLIMILSNEIFYEMGFFVGFMIFIYLIISTLVKFCCTQLIITDRRIVAKKGFINTNVLDLPLDKINSVYVEVGLFGKICRYGTLKFSTSKGGAGFCYIKNPYRVRSQITEQIEYYKEQKIKKQAKEMAMSMAGIYF